MPSQTATDGTAIAPLNVTAFFRDPDAADTIVLSVPAATLPVGVTFDPATGTFSGTPDASASQGGPAGNGIYPVTVTATDSHGATVTTVVTFTVGNPPPVAVADLLDVPANVVGTGTVLYNDHDGGTDTDALTVTQVNGIAITSGSVITLPSGALLTMNSNGTYSYNSNGLGTTLGFGQTAPDSFTYQVSDGNGGFDTATVNITIGAVNLPPVVVNPLNPGTPPADPNHIVPPLAGADGTTLAPLSVAAYFGDTNTGDVLTFSVPPASLPPGVTFDATTGTFSGTPTADASQGGPAGTGVYPIVVTASDGHGGTVSTIVTMTFTNPAPVAVNDGNTVAEHGTVGGDVTPGAGNDRDGGADTDPLTVTEVNGTAVVAGGTITLPSGAQLVMAADGTYTYDPHGAFNGLPQGQTAADSFTYLIADGQGGTALATVSITITGENDAPVVVDPANPGTPVVPGSQVLPTQPANDGSPMTPVNVTGLFADPDRTDTLTLSVPPTALPPGIVFDPATGTFSGTPTADASQGSTPGLPAGTYQVVVTATDSHGATVTTVVVFQIANPAPTANPDRADVPEHATVTGNVITSSDVDGGTDTDVLTVTQINGSPLTPGVLIPLASGATLVMAADGTYTYNPNGAFLALGLGQTATETFTYQISDGQGGTSTALVTLIIHGQNDAPVVVDTTGTPVPPGTPVVPVQTASDGTPITPISVIALFTDPDTGDTLTLSVPPTSLPPGVTFNPLTGTFSGTPTADASQGGTGATPGVYDVVVTATDSHGATVTTVVTFSIANPAPVAVNDSNTVAEHGSVGGDVTPGTVGNDRDGGSDTDVLTVTQVNGTAITAGATITLPSGALLVMAADGTYTYDPNGTADGLGLGQTATDTFTYQINDGQGGVATATVTLTINGQNDTPLVINPATGLPAADPLHVVPIIAGRDGDQIAPVNVVGVFVDPDRIDTLTYSVDPSTLPPGIVFNPTTGIFTGVPTSDASIGGPAGDGIYAVSVTASDGHGGTVSTIVTFTFSNPVPVAANDLAFTQPDQSVTIPVLLNDHDGGLDSDTLTVTSATSAGGTVSINPDGSLNFMPTPGLVGLVTIEYTITDGQGGFATATARVLITPNIPTQGPTTSLPGASEAAPLSNTGIAATGVILTTVQGISDLGTSSQGIAAPGIIVATANQISNLGGLGGIAGGSHIDPRTTNPVWRLEQMIERQFGRSDATWNPEGLTGFSLRYTFASEQSTNSHAQLVLDSLVRDRTLIVNMSGTSIPDHAKIVEYRVMQADGRPLPGWLDRAGPQVLIGERPADVEVIKLRVIAILSDGTSIERDVVIQANSGEIKPLNEKRAEAPPLFSDDLKAKVGQSDAAFDQLLKSLAR